MLSDDQLLRYSRQIMLPSVDIEGQLAFANGHALIIGLGGLGSPVAMYLAAAGVGQLTLVDDDIVELSNLQRQVIHTQARLGQTKVASAAEGIRALNPDTQVNTIDYRLDEAGLSEAIAKADVVLDCTDNFSTRFAINRACVEHKVPLVSGAAIRLEGQVSVFDSRQDKAPCYQCLYGGGDDENLTCAESGVLAPLVGIIGSMQALEALKVLGNVGESLAGRLVLFDAATHQWRTLKLPKDPECSVCGH